MSSEEVDTVKKQLETDIVLSPFFEALTEAGLKDIAFSNGKSKGVDKDTITARTSPSSASNSVSKKKHEIGKNWIMVLHNPEESFDFAKILDNNGKRFKYAVWQYVGLEGTLYLQAYIEGRDKLTIGMLKYERSGAWSFYILGDGREKKVGYAVLVHSDSL